MNLAATQIESSEDEVVLYSEAEQLLANWPGIMVVHMDPKKIPRQHIVMQVIEKPEIHEKLGNIQIYWDKYKSGWYRFLSSRIKKPVQFGFMQEVAFANGKSSARMFPLLKGVAQAGIAGISVDLTKYEFVEVAFNQTSGMFHRLGEPQKQIYGADFVFLGPDSRILAVRKRAGE